MINLKYVLAWWAVANWYVNGIYHENGQYITLQYRPANKEPHNINDTLYKIIYICCVFVQCFQWLM